MYKMPCLIHRTSWIQIKSVSFCGNKVGKEIAIHFTFGNVRLVLFSLKGSTSGTIGLILSFLMVLKK
jgi:hypothetical protein